MILSRSNPSAILEGIRKKISGKRQVIMLTAKRPASSFFMSLPPPLRLATLNPQVHHLRDFLFAFFLEKILFRHNFIRRFPLQCFPWGIVKLSDILADELIRVIADIGSLWNESPD